MRARKGPPSADARIATLAARQYGVVGRRQLLEAGVSRNAIAYRLADQRLHHVHEGVYAVGIPRPIIEGRWLAAVLASGEGAVLSHRAAAAHLGLRPAWRDRVEVSAARSVKYCRGVTTHRPRRLADHERTTHLGIPVTTVSRTLTDVADVAHARVLRQVLEQAEILRLDATPEVIPGRRGAGRLARALAELRPHVPLTRSQLEIRFLEICRDAGLPRPLVNTSIDGMEVDFCWPAARLVVEADGWGVHSTHEAFKRDRRRSALLSMRGWTVTRFSDDDIVRDRRYVESTLTTLIRNGLGPSERA